MENKLISIMLAGTLMLFSGTGLAGSAEKDYIGVQYGIGNYSEKNISEDFKPTAAIVRFGHYFRPRYSIEGRLGFGLQDDTQFLPEFGVSGLDASFELDSIIGLFATGHFNLSKSASIYGALGVSKVEVTTRVPSLLPAAISDGDETSISYGIGADIGIGKELVLSIEYMRYLDKTDFDLSMTGVGVSFKF